MKMDLIIKEYRRTPCTAFSAQKGFTLIETLVAITILITAITVPMAIAAKGLQSAFYAKEHMTAVHLAQEGMELMREKRDSYALSHRGLSGGANDDWTSIIPASCAMSGSGCDIDVRNGNFLSCAGSPSPCKLNYDATAVSSSPVKRGMYTHVAGGIVSPFTRVIKMESTMGNGHNEQSVLIEVSWQANVFLGVKTVKLQGKILNSYDGI